MTTPMSEPDKAVLRVIARLDQEQCPVCDTDVLAEMMRAILAQEKESVYKLLHALVLSMSACGHHRTGKLLEQARKAFFEEGQS